MSASKKKAFVFFITILISFMVLSSIFLVVLILTKSDSANIEQEAVPYISEYNPSREENLGVLILGCELAESMPEVAVLLYYDAPQGVIYPIVLPSVTVSTLNGKTDTLQGHYDYEGMQGAVNAVKELFNIELDRYIRIQRSGIANAVDFFGGVSHEVSHAQSFSGEAFQGGLQLLDGRRFSAILFDENRLGTTDYTLQSNMIAKLISQSFNESLAMKYDSLLNTIYYNSETNLTQYDFGIRKTGFLNLLKRNEIITSEVILGGEYNSLQSEFYPDKASIGKIKEIFS